VDKGGLEKRKATASFGGEGKHHQSEIFISSVNKCFPWGEKEGVRVDKEVVGIKDKQRGKRFGSYNGTGFSSRYFFDFLKKRESRFIRES